MVCRSMHVIRDHVMRKVHKREFQPEAKETLKLEDLPVSTKLVDWQQLWIRQGQCVGIAPPLCKT